MACKGFIRSKMVFIMTSIMLTVTPPMLIGCVNYSSGSGVTKIVANTLSSSVEIDEIQERLSPYSDQSLALSELDRIQLEIRYALLGNVNLSKVRDLYSRSLNVYGVLSNEITENWNRISESDQLKINKINGELIVVDYEINKLIELAKDTVEQQKVLKQVLEMGQMAMKAYKVYEMANSLNG